MMRFLTRLFLMLLVLAMFPAPGKAGKTIFLPMSIDYALLNALARNAFAGDEEYRKTFFSEPDGCRRVVASAPHFREDQGELFMESRVHLRYGRSLDKFCLFPMTFDGILVVRQLPKVDPSDWTLRFTPLSSQFLTLDGEPAKLASIALSLVQDHVLETLTVSVDLGFPRQELEAFLTMTLPHENPQKVLDMLGAMQPGEVVVLPEKLYFESSIEVFDDLYRPESYEPEPLLSQEELEAFIDSWEVWDAFVVHIITSLASKPLSEEEQLLLLDVLLQLRYDFLLEIEDSSPPSDLIRRQFVDVWARLGPLFRSHLLASENDSLLGYLAFFSASDALLVLDELGVLFGLDISRDGLLRLVRLLGEGKDSTLEYGPEVLPDLLRSLGFENHSSLEDPSLPSSGQPWFWGRVSRFFAAPAWAGSAGDYSVGRDDQWVFRRSDVHGYLDRIQNLLREQAGDTVRESTMSAPHQDIFEEIVLATAWQESCFRHFIATGEQVSFLRSYNNSSVGLMQINERVWRGIYDQHKLRWDIVYNARTGTKILDLYLVKYAEPRMRNQEFDWSADTVAGMLYAMYNGGPGQLGRYLQRLDEGNTYRSDALFKEKWIWVRQNDLDKGSICLVGH